MCGVLCADVSVCCCATVLCSFALSCVLLRGLCLSVFVCFVCDLSCGVVCFVVFVCLM